MKNRFWFLFLSLSLGLSSWGSAQNTRTDLFDLKKSQQELEIMRGILSTTLTFVVRELQGKAASSQNEFEKAYIRSGWGISGISAFYLYGQGAVFVIPASNFRGLLDAKGKPPFGMLYAPAALADQAAVLEIQAINALEIEARNEEVAVLAQQMAELTPPGVQVGIEGGVVGGVAGGVPGGVIGGVKGGVGVKGRTALKGAPQAPSPEPSATTPPSRPARQAPAPTRSEEEMKKKLAEVQERVKQRRDEAAAKRAKFLEQISQIKVYLIEALANHADSLTHVRPNEYITIIITTDEGDFGLRDDSGPRSQREVLSVQKSAVTDYKAGKLSLDAFKQKVLNYGT